MTSATGVSGSVLAQAYAAEQSIQATARQTSQSQGSGGGFGSAVNLTLSAPAQVLVSSSGGPVANAAGPSAPHSPGVPIVGSSTTTDTETLIEEALQQVIPKVGVTDASEVVDGKGDIDEVKLQQLIAQQDQPESSRRAIASPVKPAAGLFKY